MSRFVIKQAFAHRYLFSASTLDLALAKANEHCKGLCVRVVDTQTGKVVFRNYQVKA